MTSVPAFDPWRHVVCDDDLVADLLAGTVDAVAEAGGWVHPAARFVIRQGQGSVRCEGIAGEPLLRIPRSALVRIGRVGWSTSSEALEFDAVPSEFSSIETELLVLQAALHNACGKIPWLVSTHPVLAPDFSDDVIDAIRAFRPRFRRRQPSAAGLFWSDRVFRLPVGDDGAVEPVAVPLIDLLDHARDGSTPTWSGTEFSVDIAHAGELGECRLDYGLQRDAIGMAVVYGFVASDSAIAHSAPVSVDVPGFGRVRVQAQGRRRDGTLMPTQVRRSADGLVISHVSFGAGQTGVLPAGVVAAIANANLRLLDVLLSATTTCSGAAAATIARAAEVQAQVIRASV